MQLDTRSVEHRRTTMAIDDQASDSCVTGLAKGL